MHFSRQDVEQRILAGEHLIIFRGGVLRISNEWLSKHPGGSLALLHFVGRDASDEIEAYHDENALKLLNKFIVGTVELDENGYWEAFLPPIMSGWVRRQGSWFNEAAPFSTSDSISSEVLLLAQPQSSPTTPLSIRTLPSSLSIKEQAQQSVAYRTLHKRVIDAGLYETPYFTGYGPEVIRYILLGALSTYAYRQGWLILSAICLGFMWHQLVFFVHDLGHMGVTHNWLADRILSIVIADFIGGLSVGWWVDNHNVHHLVTNHPSHDPDIEHLPFFAISPAFFHNLWSSYYKRTMPFDRFAKVVISVQHKLFYIVMFFARFNLYVNSYVHLFHRAHDTKRIRGGKWAWYLELVGIAFFWCWFGGVLYGCGSWKRALTYLMVSHVTTSPLHVQIVLSHFSMSTEDLGPTESFVHRQMRTTSDVICHPSLAFLHGGLHLQVTHHLFPRLPRHSLLKASHLVKAFAKEEGLTYAEFGFAEGNQDVLGVLKGVADQVRIMGNVAEVEAREAIEKKLNGKPNGKH